MVFKLALCLRLSAGAPSSLWGSRGTSFLRSGRLQRRWVGCEVQRLNSFKRAAPRTRTVTVLALGDFGYPTEQVVATGTAMSEFLATSGRCAALVLGLGDNFYPHGVDSVDDERFRTYWEDVFLVHAALRVPWRMCLGNHDYLGNWRAQIDFTSSERNPGFDGRRGLWQCIAQSYDFWLDYEGRDSLSGQADGPKLVEFFCLDTNGAQFQVRQAHPHLETELRDSIAALRTKLAECTARWKVVFAHHPLHTKGRSHGLVGRCLRDHRYALNDGSERDGYGLEDVLVENGVDVYISGHEHRFQHNFARGVHHFVCGASGYENSLYGGADPATEMTWVDDAQTDGFVALEVGHEAINVKVVSNASRVVNEVNIAKE